MSFQPVLPLGGYAGWQFLQKTLASQQQSYDSAAQMTRDTDYFAANIGKVTTVDQLMADPKLLRVALGAFGLSDQSSYTALIRKVLTQGSTSSTALANTLSDKRWLAFAQSFNFGDGGTPNTTTSGFAARIVSAYQSQSFTAAVSTANADLGLALGMQTALPGLASASSSEAAKWYTILGTTSMRTMLQTALGLPASIASIDIDKQVTLFQNRMQQVFGDSSVAQFSDPASMDKLTKLFLVRSAASGAGSGSAASAALTLLGATPASGSGGLTLTGSGSSAGIASLFT